MASLRLAGALRGPVGPIYLSVFLFTCGEGTLHLLVPPYLATEFTLGPAAIGAVVGVFGLAALATRLPTGMLYAQRRSQALLVIGGALSALAFALVPAVSGVGALAALMAVDGIGFAIATTTQLALLVAVRPSGRPLAATMGWYAGFVGLGHMVAGVGAGVAADTVGFDASFYAFAALPALGALVAVAARIAPAAPTTPAGTPTATEQRGHGIRALLSAPAAVWSGLVVMFTINALSGAVTTFFPVLALAAGLTLTQIGILASCRSWASASVRFGSGLLFSRIRADGLTAPLLVLGAVAVVLMPSAQSSFLLALPLFLAAGFSRGLLRVTGSAAAFAQIEAGERRRGITAALLLGGLDLGRVAGPFVAGLIAQATSIATMFRILPVVLLGVWAGFELRARRTGAVRAASKEALQR